MSLTVKDYLERPISVLIKLEEYKQDEFDYVVNLYQTPVHILMKEGLIENRSGSETNTENR